MAAFTVRPDQLDPEPAVFTVRPEDIEAVLPAPAEAVQGAQVKAQQAADITTVQASQMLQTAGQRMLQGAIPPGLQPAEQDPLLDKRPLPALNPNLQSIVSGVEQMAQPALQEKAGAAHKILSGAMGIGAGAIPIAAAAAPIATAVGLGTGALAQTGTEAGLKKAGVPENYANLAGDVAGLVAGGAVGHGLGKPEGRAPQEHLESASEAPQERVASASSEPSFRVQPEDVTASAPASEQTITVKPEDVGPFEEFLRGKEARNVPPRPAPEPQQPAPQQSPFEASGGKIISFEPHKGADIPGDFLTVAAHPQGPGADEGIRQIHEFNPQGSTRWPPDLEAKLAEHGLTPENIVGYSRVRPDVYDPSDLSSIATHVAEDFRHQGIATRMYDESEAAQGARLGRPASMQRSEILSPDAEAFWENRQPDEPQQAFTNSFQDRQPAREEAFVEGSGLGPIGSRIFDRFKTEGPPENYSGMGAAKDRFVRNLSQLEEADPEAHAAAIKAASSRAQSSALINTAAPQIERALGKDGPTATDFRRTLIEDNLQGRQKRWNDLAQEAKKIPVNKLVEWATNGPLQLLGNMQDRLSPGVNPAQTAAALAERGNLKGLRQFVTQTFKDAAGNVTHVMSPQEYQANVNSPGFQRALPVYKSLLEQPLAENHASNEGVFSDALGQLKTYYPLTPVTDADMVRASVGSKGMPYRAPGNPSNRFSTGLADEYDPAMAAFKDRITRAFKANDRAAMLNTLEDKGLLQRNAEGATINYQGRDFPAVRVPVGPERVIVQDGKVTRVPQETALMPKFLARELDPILNSKENAQPGTLSRIFSAINRIALSGPADAVFHSHNLLGSLVANTPFIGRDLASKTVGNTPFTKIFTAIAQIATTDPLSKEAAVDLQQMAKLGILPERYAQETFSKRFAEQTGAEHKNFLHGFGPLLYGPKGIDVRARLVMYRTAKEMNPNAGPSELHMFVNQLGNYTTALQGSLERMAKSTGLSPFYTAGSTMLRNGINAWLGTGPTAGSGPAARIAQQLSGGAVALVGGWAVTYKAYTGKWPWNDPRAKFLKIPLNPEHRNSALGKAVFGKDTRRVGYINFGFASPLVARGGRAMGISGAFNTAVEGGSPAQIAQGAKADIVNTAAQPFFGPPARIGLVAATGKQPYLVRDTDAGGLKPLPAIDKKAPIGSEALTALKQLNSFYGNVGAATGMGSGANDHGQSVQDQLLKAVLDMAGVLGGSSNPYKATQSLRQERRRHR